MNRENRKVPIKNVLYMFSYVWDEVNAIEKINLDANDKFDSANILSELFLMNVNNVTKQGLYKEYREHSKELSGIKGKIDFRESINNLSFENAKAVCIYDELEVNNLINQVIKSTARRLYKSENITDINKQKLRKVLLDMNDVDFIELSKKSFEIQFNRNNLYNKLLILICELIYDSMMLSEETGKYIFIDILDDDIKMSRVFEKFVYKFYYKHLTNCKVWYQRPVNWELSGGNQSLIPEMKLDVLVENNDEIVIIDTKYKHSTRTSYLSSKQTLISENMYQMYTYLNNYNANKKVRGVLLYPSNGNNINEDYNLNIMKNNQIQDSRLSIRTIDLSKDWQEIENDLLNNIL